MWRKRNRLAFNGPIETDKEGEKININSRQKKHSQILHHSFTSFQWLPYFSTRAQKFIIPFDHIFFKFPDSSSSSSFSGHQSWNSLWNSPIIKTTNPQSWRGNSPSPCSINPSLPPSLPPLIPLPTSPFPFPLISLPALVSSSLTLLYRPLLPPPPPPRLLRLLSLSNLG